MAHSSISPDIAKALKKFENANKENPDLDSDSSSDASGNSWTDALPASLPVSPVPPVAGSDIEDGSPSDEVAAAFQDEEENKQDVEDRAKIIKKLKEVTQQVAEMEQPAEEMEEVAEEQPAEERAPTYIDCFLDRVL